MDDSIRKAIWNNLSNIKFKALYTNALSRKSRRVGNLYSFFLAFASASSVATWTFWSEFPILWAIIISIAQLMQVAKPYIPFLKNEREFMELSFEFDKLYLAYEELWYSIDQKQNEQDWINETFFRFRRGENSIEKKHKNVHCPKWNGLISKIQNETYNELSINFEV